MIWALGLIAPFLVFVALTGFRARVKDRAERLVQMQSGLREAAHPPATQDTSDSITPTIPVVTESHSAFDKLRDAMKDDVYNLFGPLHIALVDLIELVRSLQIHYNTHSELAALEVSLAGFALIAGASTAEPTAATNNGLRSLLRAVALLVLRIADAWAPDASRVTDDQTLQHIQESGDGRVILGQLVNILKVFEFTDSLGAEARLTILCQQLSFPTSTSIFNARSLASIVNQNDNNSYIFGSGSVTNNNLAINYIQIEEEQQKAMKKITAALQKRHVPEAVYNAQLNPGCMENTRVRILREMKAWIMNPIARRICWITGMAGTGKTTIAKTICVEAKSDAAIVLGGSFFCSRATGLASQRDIRCVVPTLAQLFAQQSAEFRLALAGTIDPGIQHLEVAAQVEQLLYTPLLALRDSCVPILFVIDALDECGGETSDGILDNAECHAVVASILVALVGLTQSDPKLPVKFLVTSRPEPQIRDTPISSDKLSQILRLHTVDITEVNADIRQYITRTLDNKLSNQPKLRAAISDGEVENLVRLSDGLFIVAATALKHTIGAGADAAVSKFKRLLNGSGDSLNARAASPLDGIYAMILLEAASENGSEATDLPALLRLLASLLSARMTLSIAALAELLDLETYDVRASLSRLHSVVHVPEDDDVPGLRTVHASFGDYLHGRAASHIRFSRSFGHTVLGHACLNEMGRRLHFNISHSPSSYDSNPSARPNSISIALEYACLHWAHHIAAYRPGDEIVSDVSSFDAKIGRMFRPKFLFWLEVMSALDKFSLTPGLLSVAHAVVSDILVSQFLRDAKVFVASSHDAIERSAPHIYLSALPFADKKSLVYEDFTPHCTGLITVATFGIRHHSGTAVMTLTGHSGPVHSVSYSSDGLFLASGSADGTVRIWDTQTGEEAISPLRSEDGSVLSVDCAKNGKWVASGTEAGIVCVWSIEQNQGAHRRLCGHSGTVYSVAFSPDSSRLASASKDQSVHLWNPETGDKLAVLIGHTESVDGVAFAPDGKILASASGNRTIKLWDSTTGQQIARKLQPMVPNDDSRPTITTSRGVDFSPDGEMIAAASSGVVLLQRRETDKRIAQLRGTARFRSARFSSNGQSLVAAHGHGVRLWSLHPALADAHWDDLGSHKDNVNWVTFSPNNLYIASASDDTTIRIWNADSTQPTVKPLEVHTSQVFSVAVSRDDSFIVSGGRDRSVRVWNAYTGEERLTPMHGHQFPINSVAISPDGRLIASASTDETICLWAAQSGVAVAEPMHGHTAKVTAVRFSNSGHWLASASEDSTVRFWDVTKRQPSTVGQLRCTNDASAVAFSPDDKWVAAGVNGCIDLWRLDTGQRAQMLFPTGRQLVGSLVFSPDGTRIVSGGLGNAASIWSVSTRHIEHELQVHTSNLWSVAWSPDGHLIGTGSSDQTVRLWNALTGAPLATLYGHAQRVASVAFTSDGQFIISGSDDSTIRKWDVQAACKSDSERSHNPDAVLASTRVEDGWLVGSSGELLLWVPAEYRGYIQTHICTLQISKCRVVVEMPDGGLHAGPNWTSCWRD